MFVLVVPVFCSGLFFGEGPGFAGRRFFGQFFFFRNQGFCAWFLFLYGVCRAGFFRVLFFSGSSLHFWAVLLFSASCFGVVLHPLLLLGGALPL